MKTYILKYDIHNNVRFPAGTIVKITDDYWGGNDESNTGFTVAEGELKGKKGHVVNGLDGWLLEDTKENRKAVKNLYDKQKEIEKMQNTMREQYDNLKTAKL